MQAALRLAAGVHSQRELLDRAQSEDAKRQAARDASAKRSRGSR
jgi:hypothetical protein